MADLSELVCFEWIPLPENPGRSPHVPHAPKRDTCLSPEEEKMAVANALRYVPPETHDVLGPEFMTELRTYGHIYAYRFKPTSYKMKAYPFSDYPAQTNVGKALQLMIMNNLDPDVAQYPEELITYGGNGSVLSNWMQYRLVMLYLSQMGNNQTLSMQSGHPLGLFPSPEHGPRCVITNGQMIPNYSNTLQYKRLYALGCTIYGQMTAGSYCYIGPMGIVHGTTLTILNSGRKYLKTSDLTGKIFVTAGLGGMSGAQAKAATICGAIAIIAEVDGAALTKRFEQGWLLEKAETLDETIRLAKLAREESRSTSIGFLGNVVDLWERLATENLEVQLGSDQTSLHDPFGGGYIPVGLSLEESRMMISEDAEMFKVVVQKSLVRHVAAINEMTRKGMYFFDYGNGFLLQSRNAGADITKDGISFRYPSYVEDVMGDIFSLGFGPFRWVCTSGKSDDLRTTDRIAAEVLTQLAKEAPARSQQQYEDNIRWINAADSNKLVVGSQARILYSDEIGRRNIALAFNKAVREGVISAPVVISRDHHDVSGTDSPYRETSNIRDGSMFTADMAVQNVIGDSFRGAHWVALHNGGGVGWGYVINGGFGILLDGSEDSDQRADGMLKFDVLNGVSRRAWARNENALATITKAIDSDSLLQITVPNLVDEQLIASLK